MTVKISSRSLGIISFVTGAIAICFLILPYLLFPQFYVPKANSAIGYVGPATVEGWIFMITGLSLIGVTIILRILRRQSN